MENNKIVNSVKKIFKFIIYFAIALAVIFVIAAVMYIIFWIFYYFYDGPSKNDFDRRIEWEYFWEKDKSGVCIIDLAEIMNFEWDSLKYYSLAYEPNEIDKDLGLTLNVYQDVGSKIIFMRGGEVVCYREYFPYPYENNPGGVFFLHDGDKFTVYPRNAKFKAYKNDEKIYDPESKFIFLMKMN